MRPAEPHSPSAEENCLTKKMYCHDLPSRWLHPLYAAKAAIHADGITICWGHCRPQTFLTNRSPPTSLKKRYKNDPPYGCNHMEDQLFYRHRPMRPCFLLCKENHRQCRWFQKALTMQNALLSEQSEEASIIATENIFDFYVDSGASNMNSRQGK